MLKYLMYMLLWQYSLLVDFSIIFLQMLICDFDAAVQISHVFYNFSGHGVLVVDFRNNLLHRVAVVAVD